MFMQNIPISKILYCSKIYTKPATSLKNNGRHSHALVFFVEGRCDYTYDGKVYSASAGSILFLPKGQKYVIQRHTDAQCIYVDFLTCTEADFSPFVKNYPNTSQFRDAFVGLFHIYKQKRVGYESEMMSQLYKIVSMIQIADRIPYLPDAKYQTIAPAIELINKNYCTKITISELSSKCGISTRYFGELFAVFFGTSPKDYIIRLRIETAKNLLISSDESLESISDVCGFSDVYYFSKVFKKATGETPGAFRKSNKML